MPSLFASIRKYEKKGRGETRPFFVEGNKIEEGEEKGRFVPSHGGEGAKALQRKNGGSFLC